MAETFFDELKRYIRFGEADGEALRALHPIAAPHFERITDEFYDRLLEHEEARTVLSGSAQVARLKRTLVEWLNLLLTGPWDEAYYERRARIGRMHVKITLPQRYMFAAMNLIHVSLQRLAHDAHDLLATGHEPVVVAIAKVIDLELAIMLETYREAFVDKVQHLERLERTLLERRLAISEARYEEIVEKVEALIVTVDREGNVLFFNRRCEVTTGIPREEAVGRELTKILGDGGALEQRMPAVFAGERVAPWEGPLVGADGTTHRVRWHLTTLPGGIGPVLCAIGIDVTDEHDLAVRTRRAERLAALGTMAAGLAHEIRNPMNAAHLQLTLLQRRLGRGEPDIPAAQTAAELAANEIKRLAKLVSEFLQFARPQPLRFSAADLHATAEVIVSLLAPEAGAAGVQIRLVGDEPVIAEVDDERIKQVMLNLARNAVEAAGRGGNVRLSVTSGEAQILIAVEDDGPGLPSPDAPIFEPFFTTKEGGTGLGLAIVHRIVTDHGGVVTVETRPGRTVFTVSIPRS